MGSGSGKEVPQGKELDLFIRKDTSNLFKLLKLCHVDESKIWLYAASEGKTTSNMLNNNPMLN